MILRRGLLALLPFHSISTHGYVLDNGEHVCDVIDNLKLDAPRHGEKRGQSLFPRYYFG